VDKKLANAKQSRLLWVDLEMTGLSPTEDRILELAAIVTDWDFKEIATYEAAVSVSQRLIEKRMLKGPAADFWNTVPEARDGLISQNKTSARPAKTIETELLAFLDEQFEKGLPVLLAGNSIHQDRKFIDNEWPRLSERLHYRMLDVTSWKLVFEGKFSKKFSKREAHRALDDIRGSIEELQYYLKKMKNVK
jgi:oligoribonuclease